MISADKREIRVPRIKRLVAACRHVRREIKFAACITERRRGRTHERLRELSEKPASPRPPPPSSRTAIIRLGRARALQSSEAKEVARRGAYP
jgi:hypothetical protein